MHWRWVVQSALLGASSAGWSVLWLGGDLPQSQPPACDGDRLALSLGHVTNHFRIFSILSFIFHLPSYSIYHVFDIRLLPISPIPADITDLLPNIPTLPTKSINYRTHPNIARARLVCTTTRRLHIQCRYANSPSTSTSLCSRSSSVGLHNCLTIVFPFVLFLATIFPFCFIVSNFPFFITYQNPYKNLSKLLSTVADSHYIPRHSINLFYPISKL